MQKKLKTKTHKPNLSRMKRVILMIAMIAISVGSIAQVSFFPAKKNGIVRIDTTEEAAMGFKVPDTVLILKDTIITTNGITKRMITKRIYRPGKVNDSVLKVGVYGGILSGRQFMTNSGKVGGFTNFRVGGIIDYSPVKWVNFNVAAIYHMQTGETPWDWKSTSVTFKPIKGFTGTIGYMATLNTEQRPYPVSNSGHFEPSAHSQAPGGERGAKIKYQFNNGLEFGTGVALRNDQLEYAGRVSYKSVELSSWYSTWSNECGAILSITKGRVSSVLVYKQNDEIPGVQQRVVASFVDVVVSKKYNIHIYNDLGFQLHKGKPLDRGETGLLVCFDSPYLKGLIGLGWDYKNEFVVPYLFITL